MVATYKGDIRNGEIELVEEVEVFKNQYATLYNDRVNFPSGQSGEYLRFIWNAPYGVMILARDSSGGLLLLRNFRHETRGWEWELPKGFGEATLTPLECAKKELLEETGCNATSWKLLRTVGDKGRETYLFQCVVDNTPTVAQQEDKEAIDSIRIYSPAECEELLLNNDLVRDPATLFALSWCVLNKP